jgi:hypothetical protein
MSQRGWVAAGLVIGGLVCASPAAANEPATAGAVQLGLGFRYGLELEEGDFNPWGTGIGIDGGYTLQSAIYLGGNFEYFFGEERETELVTLTGNIWQLMAEGGYDLGFGQDPWFVLRPKVGVGVAGVQTEACIPAAGCADDSGTYFAMAPGATFMFLTKGFSMSLDLRYDMIFAEEETLNALIFSLGVGF